MAFELKTKAFAPDSKIPARYTCDGENHSPSLEWENAPPATKSFALISDDPDAPIGTWVHWVVYDMPGSSTSLEEALPPSEVLPDGSKQGLTDFNRPGYGGPCPPPRKTSPLFL
jgi:Raf kinase inhibitor-like YbhB/YbcL family protein